MHPELIKMIKIGTVISYRTKSIDFLGEEIIRTIASVIGASFNETTPSTEWLLSNGKRIRDNEWNDLDCKLHGEPPKLTPEEIVEKSKNYVSGARLENMVPREGGWELTFSGNQEGMYLTINVDSNGDLRSGDFG